MVVYRRVGGLFAANFCACPESCRYVRLAAATVLTARFDLEGRYRPCPRRIRANISTALSCMPHRACGLGCVGPVVSSLPESSRGSIAQTGRAFRRGCAGGALALRHDGCRGSASPSVSAGRHGVAFREWRLGIRESEVVQLHRCDGLVLLWKDSQARLHPHRRDAGFGGSLDPRWARCRAHHPGAAGPVCSVRRAEEVVHTVSVSGAARRGKPTAEFIEGLFPPDRVLEEVGEALSFIRNSAGRSQCVRRGRVRSSRRPTPAWARSPAVRRNKRGLCTAGTSPSRTAQ